MSIDRDALIRSLNRIVEHELAGAVRYTQYSLMVFGHARIPIISWMQAQAQESLAHATQAGEEVTTIGGQVSLGIGELVGTHHASIDDIMKELVAHERQGVTLYEALLGLVEGKSVSLEEYARGMIRAEKLHTAEILKMLNKRAGDD
ncbi:MAG: ferritin-like domain-containing protein [Spirochaetaceae bacterium]|nr:ferritin-like domain-containing protein [Spirochaetaceae bacterium]HPG25809.1 ferritin-like domain-containing protein [Myxococcota bacterium]